MVKGIGFEFNEENGGKDIFSRIIPLEAHTASSLYSEEKAKVLRDLGTKVDLKDESLEKFLASMNLEQVPNAGDHIALPQELIECAAELSGVQDKPVKKLSETMAKLAGISADVQAHLDSIQDIIEKDIQDVNTTNDKCNLMDITKVFTHVFISQESTRERETTLSLCNKE